MGNDLEEIKYLHMVDNNNVPNIPALLLVRPLITSLWNCDHSMSLKSAL